MFSTKSENKRFYITCNFVLGTRYDTAKIGRTEFIVDTGAKRTCCHYTGVDCLLEERSFKDMDCLYVGGFVDGAYIKFYKYHIPLFMLGEDISLRERDIWITFDNRLTDYVLGMDILENVSYLFNQLTGEMIFFQSYQELVAYIVQSES